MGETMRVLRIAVMILFAVMLVAPDMADAARGRARRVNPNTGLKDPRYSALVINPKTGEIYHEAAADKRRAPASLTKMMTLYLLFEALENHTVGMGTKMRVSDYASVQPQTNLSLNTSDRIDVELAIKALVVRSANDVAVVVAEHLGGSVPGFARMMNAKAAALGMKNSHFENPNGLPNAKQYTTARDMAKIGIALKRDFPQYYRYFSVRQFSFKGVTYYTHNRVMLRYAGTDGIKTGYTNAAGFNLVTSTERGGRPLIGVVLGGTSGNWRDDRMIQLMDAGYATLAKRGSSKGVLMAQNLPYLHGKPVELPKPAAPPPITNTNVAANVPAVSADRGVIQQAQNTGEIPTSSAVALPTATAPSTIPAADAPVIVTSEATAQAPEIITVAPASPVQVTKAEVAPAARPVAVTPPKQIVITPPAAAPPPHTLDAQLLARQQQKGAVNVSPAQVQADSGMKNGWGIQVGAFSDKSQAERAALQAYQTAQTTLQGSRISVVGTGNSGAMVHRARLENITEKQAKKACELLISNNSPCFIYRAGAL